jgi:hypothetical protein
LSDLQNKCHLSVVSLAFDKIKLTLKFSQCENGASYAFVTIGMEEIISQRKYS